MLFLLSGKAGTASPRFEAGVRWRSGGLNVCHDAARVGAVQRPPRTPAKVQRLGHVVVQTTRFRQTLDWYLEHLGLIVSDFLYHGGRRERGPVMSFIRCDLGRLRGHLKVVNPRIQGD